MIRAVQIFAILGIIFTQEILHFMKLGSLSSHKMCEGNEIIMNTRTLLNMYKWCTYNIVVSKKEDNNENIMKQRRRILSKKARS